jgi:hypothetical protein
MSIRLILEEYLGMMKESGELDVFMPELLAAMDHKILSEPQRGVRQFGVDIASRGPDESGVISLHLWVLKGGDVDRSVWSSGNQCMRNALVEIEDVYLGMHVLARDAPLPKVIHLLTNAEFRQEVQVDIVQYAKNYTGKTGVSVELTNGSTLAAWTEKYLLDEHILPAPHRSVFRKSLAMVETPDVCYRNARALIIGLLADIPGASPTATHKGRIRALRAVSIAVKVLLQWASTAGNIDGAYRASEFAILKAWCFIRSADLQKNDAAGEIFGNIFGDYLNVATAYVEKLEPYYATENALAALYRENLLVADRVFEELGRIGLLVCAHRFYGGTLGAENARELGTRLVALLRSHSVSGSPCFDSQSTEISLAMLGLVAAERVEVAKEWLDALVKRLGIAKKFGRYAPIASDSFDDLVAFRNGEETEMSLAPFARSTLLPILGFWCVQLGARDSWQHLVNEVVPLFPETTLNLWRPDETYEDLLADGVKITRSGLTEAFTEMPAGMTEFQSMLAEPVANVADVSTLGFVGAGWAWLSLLASRHWNLQIAHLLLEHQMTQLARPRE